MPAKAKKPRLPMPSGWKMEPLTERMRTPCACCRKPCTGPFRFKHTIEGYPFPETKVYRAECAIRAMRESVDHLTKRINDVETYLKDKT